LAGARSTGKSIFSFRPPYEATTVLPRHSNTTQRPLAGLRVNSFVWHAIRGLAPVLVTSARTATRGRCGPTDCRSRPDRQRQRHHWFRHLSIKRRDAWTVDLATQLAINAACHEACLLALFIRVGALAVMHNSSGFRRRRSRASGSTMRLSSPGPGGCRSDRGMHIGQHRGRRIVQKPAQVAV
jgi:hypothetical protein